MFLTLFGTLGIVGSNSALRSGSIAQSQRSLSSLQNKPDPNLANELKVNLKLNNKDIQNLRNLISTDTNSEQKKDHLRVPCRGACPPPRLTSPAPPPRPPVQPTSKPLTPTPKLATSSTTSVNISLALSKAKLNFS